MVIGFFSGCGGVALPLQEADAGQGTAGSAQVGSEGTISAQVELPPGTLAATSAYVLRGPNDFVRSATMSVSGGQPIAFAIDQIPPGSGYTLDATVVAEGGTEDCSGSALFDISGMETTFVTLIAQCSASASAASGFGTVDVDVKLPANVAVSTLAYFLNGPSGPPIQGALNTTNTSEIQFAVNDVPVGTGVKLAVSGTTRFGGGVCGASSSFDVLGGQTTQTILVLECAASSAAPH